MIKREGGRLFSVPSLAYVSKLPDCPVSSCAELWLVPSSITLRRGVHGNCSSRPTGILCIDSMNLSGK